MTTTHFRATGLTCGHCVQAVASELRALPGVTEVEIDLRAGAMSTLTVTSDVPLRRDAVAAALDEAGDYELAP